MNHAASQRNSKLESHPRGWHGVARRLQSESGLWNYRWIPRTRSAFHLSCSSITQRASDVSRGVARENSLPPRSLSRATGAARPRSV